MGRREQRRETARGKRVSEEARERSGGTDTGKE